MWEEVVMANFMELFWNIHGGMEGEMKKPHNYLSQESRFQADI
jgi:Mn-containing catalase